MRIFLTIASCITGSVFYGQDTILTRKTQADTLSVKYLEEVIVSASRVREKILQSPVSVEKVSEGYFKSNAAFSFFDALENIKDEVFLLRTALCILLRKN